MGSEMVGITSTILGLGLLPEPCASQSYKGAGVQGKVRKLVCGQRTKPQCENHRDGDKEEREVASQLAGSQKAR